MKRDKLATLQYSVLTALIVVAMPEMAFADFGAGDNRLSGSVEAIQGGISNMPGLVSGLAYIIGAVLVLSGALSLKKHSENPSGEPMGKGIGRILAGGGVIALPALASYIRTSAGFGEGEVGYTELNAIPT